MAGTTAAQPSAELTSSPRTSISTWRPCLLLAEAGEWHSYGQERMFPRASTYPGHGDQAPDRGRESVRKWHLLYQRAPTPEVCSRATAPASQREELLEHLTADEDQRAPWTFPRLVESLGSNEYEDISSELPEPAEWEAAQDPREQVAHKSYRYTSKRPAEAASAGRDTLRSRRARQERPAGSERAEEAWWQSIERTSLLPASRPLAGGIRECPWR